MLVGHSYGGAVITNAGAHGGDVEALVYVDAFIPDEGETVVGILEGSGSALAVADPTTVLDVAGYPGAPEGAAEAFLKPDTVHNSFAQDLPEADRWTIVATQRPASFVANVTPSAAPAWKTIPSWAVLGTEDRVIPIATQRRMAERAERDDHRSRCVPRVDGVASGGDARRHPGGGGRDQLMATPHREPDGVAAVLGREAGVRREHQDRRAGGRPGGAGGLRVRRRRRLGQVAGEERDVPEGEGEGSGGGGGGYVLPIGVYSEGPGGLRFRPNPVATHHRECAPHLRGRMGGGADRHRGEDGPPGLRARSRRPAPGSAHVAGMGSIKDASAGSAVRELLTRRSTS